MKQIKYLIIFVVMSIFISNLGCAGCGRGYSDGERVGVVVKFSHKGLIYKSWEGELNLGGTIASGNGVVPSTWLFTVRDEKLLSKVQEALSSGKRVKCKYIQWAVSGIDMDSSYELLDITEQ